MKLKQPGIEPSDEAFAYANEVNEFIIWPIKEDTVLANALFHVHSHSVNRNTESFINFQGQHVFIDHIIFSELVINAFSTRHQERYLAVLYTGLYLSCLDTAFTLLATRDALPEIGDHTLERPISTPQTVGSAPMRFSSQQAYFEYLGANRPRCPIRRDTAHVLAAAMLAFSFLHEEGHIMLGHVDRAIEANTSNRVSEGGERGERGARARAFRHLGEIDADKWALVSVLSPLSIKSLSLNYTSLSFSRRQWMWLSWLGAALTGALLGVVDQQNLSDPQAWVAHPHGILRARQTVRPSFAAELVEKYNDNEYWEAMGDVFSALQNLGSIWPQFGVFDTAFQLGGEVDDAIDAFNATITDDHQLEYQEMRDRFRVKPVNPVV